MSSTQQQSPQETIAQLWQQAKDLQQQGKSDAALEVYGSILELDDRYLPALHKVAQICESGGEFDRAIEVYQKAIEVDDKPPFWVYRHLGFSLSQQGELEGAIEAYRQALSLQMDDVATYNLLGQVCGKIEDLEGAVSSYGKAIELEPEQPSWVYLNFAEALERQGDLDGAIAAYEKALALEPENQGIGRLLKKIVIKRENPRSHQLVSSYQPQDEEELKAKSTQRVIEEECADFLEEDELEIPAKFDYQNYLFLNPDVLKCNGNTRDKAVEHYLQHGRSEGREYNINSSRAHFLRGELLSRTNNWDEAIVAYRRSLELNPNQGQVIQKIEDGLRLRLQKDVDEENRQTPSRSMKANLRVQLGDILAKQNQFREATVQYQQSIADDAKNRQAHYGLGLALAKLGKFEEATHAYQQAIALKLENEAIYEALGDSLAAQEKIDEASVAYHRGLKYYSNAL